VKRDKDADSVVAESEALESVINNEESKLKAASNTRQAGTEDQLRRQLKSYVDSDGLSESVMPEEQIDDSGVVDFDDQATSAVSIGRDEAEIASQPIAKAARKAQPVSFEKNSLPASHPQVQGNPVDAEDDIANVERELMPVQEASATVLAQEPMKRAAYRPAVKAELPRREELSLASQTEALDDLAGAIPNIEKEALQLYNTFGGSPDALESVGSLSGSPAFLQVSQGKQHLKHTPGVPSQADLDKTWNELKFVAQRTEGALKMIQNEKTDETDAATKSAFGLLQEKGDAGLDIDSECDWLISNFQARQQVRTQEEDLLREAHMLLGSAHVFFQHHKHHRTKQLRGQR